MGPVTAPAFAILEVVVLQQRSPLVCALSGPGRGRMRAIGLGWLLLLLRRGFRVIPQREAPVVKALRQEHDIGDGVVDGEDDHCRQDILQNGAENVEDVAEEPDDNEVQRQAIGGAAAEVLDDLGGEDDDPGGD